MIALRWEQTARGLFTQWQDCQALVFRHPHVDGYAWMIERREIVPDGPFPTLGDVVEIVGYGTSPDSQAGQEAVLHRLMAEDR